MTISKLINVHTLSMPDGRITLLPIAEQAGLCPLCFDKGVLTKMEFIRDNGPWACGECGHEIAKRELVTGGMV